MGKRIQQMYILFFNHFNANIFGSFDLDSNGFFFFQEWNNVSFSLGYRICDFLRLSQHSYNLLWEISKNLFPLFFFLKLIS